MSWSCRGMVVAGKWRVDPHLYKDWPQMLLGVVLAVGRRQRRYFLLVLGAAVRGAELLYKVGPYCIGAWGICS